MGASRLAPARLFHGAVRLSVAALAHESHYAPFNIINMTRNMQRVTWKCTMVTQCLECLDAYGELRQNEMELSKRRFSTTPCLQASECFR